MVGSVMASASSTATALIAARSVQGVGGALMLPSALCSICATFRGRWRAAALRVRVMVVARRQEHAQPG